MYKKFFGLNRNPFELSPDPSFRFASERCDEALASIYHAIARRKGFVVLTGEAGTGKTLVTRCLCEAWKQRGIPFATIIGPRLSVTDFLTYVTFDLGIKVTEATKGNLLLALYGFLQAQHEKGLTTVLLIDEAHLVRTSVLEEIRLLTNFETAQQKLLQVVLVGQPELDKKLDSVELRQLKQRIAARCRLEPLSEEETCRYIELRLKLAGANLQASTIFPAETMRAIHHCSSGIPRLINNLCEQALIAAHARQTRVVPVEIIDEAAVYFRLQPSFLAEGDEPFPLAEDKGNSIPETFREQPTVARPVSEASKPNTFPIHVEGYTPQTTQVDPISRPESSSLSVAAPENVQPSALTSAAARPSTVMPDRQDQAGAAQKNGGEIDPSAAPPVALQASASLKELAENRQHFFVAAGTPAEKLSGTIGQSNCDKSAQTAQVDPLREPESSFHSGVVPENVQPLAPTSEATRPSAVKTSGQNGAAAQKTVDELDLSIAPPVVLKASASLKELAENRQHFVISAGTPAETLSGTIGTATWASAAKTDRQNGAEAAQNNGDEIDLSATSRDPLQASASVKELAENTQHFVVAAGAYTETSNGTVGRRSVDKPAQKTQADPPGKPETSFLSTGTLENVRPPAPTSTTTRPSAVKSNGQNPAAAAQKNGDEVDLKVAPPVVLQASASIKGLAKYTQHSVVEAGTFTETMSGTIGRWNSDRTPQKTQADPPNKPETSFHTTGALEDVHPPAPASAATRPSAVKSNGQNPAAAAQKNGDEVDFSAAPRDALEASTSIKELLEEIQLSVAAAEASAETLSGTIGRATTDRRLHSPHPALVEASDASLESGTPAQSKEKGVWKVNRAVPWVVGRFETDSVPVRGRGKS